jgi:hypothetical protein
MKEVNSVRDYSKMKSAKKKKDDVYKKGKKSEATQRQTFLYVTVKVI